MEVTWQYQGQTTILVKDFLAQHGVGSRYFRKLRQQGGKIWIDRQITTGPQSLHSGQQVTVQFPNEKADSAVAVSQGPIEILAETAYWLAVNKPAGLTSVPGPANRTDTVVNRVKGYLQQQGAKDLVPHLVTRLDRFTSGIVLVAKQQLGQNLFDTLALTKYYLAVVSGQLEAQHGMIDRPLAREAASYRYSVQTGGKSAQTEYWVLKQWPNAALVKVQLHTGRTHQIRAHFTSLGHPLVGDELYHGPVLNGLKRQGLHASNLLFTDPFNQQPVHITAPVPADLQAWQASKISGLDSEL